MVPRLCVPTVRLPLALPLGTVPSRIQSGHEQGLGCLWSHLSLGVPLHRPCAGSRRRRRGAPPPLGELVRLRTLHSTLVSPYIRPSQVSIAGWIFFVGAPVAAYSGYASAYLNWVAYSNRVLKGAAPGSPGLRSAYDVELRVRYILRDVLVDERLSHTASHGGHGSVFVDRVPSAASGQRDAHVGGHAERAVQGTQLASNVRGAGLLIGGSTEDDDQRPVDLAALRSRPAVDFSSPNSRRSHARASQVLPVFAEAAAAAYAASSTPAVGRHEHLEHTAQGSRHEPAVSHEERRLLIAEAAALLEASCAAFPTAAIACALRANFIRVFIGDPDAELACINAGLSREPSLDIRFLLLQAKQQLQEQGEAGGVIAAGAHAPGHHVHSQHGTATPRKTKQLTIVEKVMYEKREFV